MRDTLRVLFLASDPFHAASARRLEEEVRAIEAAIRGSHAREPVELVPHVAMRMSDVQRAVLRHQPQVVHFAGCGDASDTVYMGDEDGSPRRMDAEALARLFRGLTDTVRVVVLEGCERMTLLHALAEVVDYTVGIEGTTETASTILFAEAFYSALAVGRTVLHAFELAASRLALEDGTRAATPVRRIRRGVNLDLPLVAPRGSAKERLRLPGAIRR